MALTRAVQTVQASASNAAGGTATSSAFAVGYGVSGVGLVTNGATGPTVGCDFVVQVSNNGGTTWFEWVRQTAPATASAVTRFPFTLGVGGQGGDWGDYRVQFTGNTGQAVTVQCDAESTTAL